ncbi:MAG TPA: lytic transglycosylase domain-containing protein [Verrucomicrobiae bacterium]|nr:lytic transglycosylase domain-containing protein [Verrucomicrobiae bacterium]
MTVTRVILSVAAVAVIFAVGLRWWWQTRLEQAAEKPILVAARRYGIDPALVKAVVWKESRFHPDARGSVGELGLMQLRQDAAREWAAAEHVAGFAHEHCLDPGTNTLAGTWYLRKVLQRYAQADDPLTFALADYNAGRGNVLKWLNGAAPTNSTAFLQLIGFPMTKEYVTAVLGRYAEYRAERGL